MYVHIGIPFPCLSNPSLPWCTLGRKSKVLFITESLVYRHGTRGADQDLCGH